MRRQISLNMLLSVITPEKILVNCEVSSAEFPGTLGPFVVLRGHAPLISSLERGKIVYTDDSGEHSIEIAHGFVEVCKDRLSACVEL